MWYKKGWSVLGKWQRFYGSYSRWQSRIMVNPEGNLTNPAQIYKRMSLSGSESAHDGTDATKLTMAASVCWTRSISMLGSHGRVRNDVSTDLWPQLTHLPNMMNGNLRGKLERGKWMSFRILRSTSRSPICDDLSEQYACTVHSRFR